MPLNEEEQRILREIEDQLRSVNPVPYPLPRRERIPMRVPPQQPRRRRNRVLNIENTVGAGCSLAIFLYLLGFLAFWAGVIYLVWRLALSS